MNICIDGESGIISTTGIDREQIPDTGYISFFVIAKDKGTPALMNQTFVKINVEDINDNRPILLETEFKFTVLEDTPLEYLTHIYKVQATDLDKSNQNKNVHYRLQDDANEVVGLDNTTGVLSMLKLPHIDQQCTNQTFSFNVIAENVVPYIPNARHPYMTITIHIEDINNQRPIFELYNKRHIIFNSNRWIPVIKRHSLHDYDCNRKYNSITFHLTDGSDRRLQINPSNGDVKYKENSTDPYRYPECSRSISVEMYATDGWFQTVQNTTLLPAETFYDPIPVKNYYTIMVKENSTYNTSYVIGFLDCSDISLKISVNDSRFNIDQTGKNGTIGVTKALDYETEQEILVIVSAYNIEKPSASSSSLVRVIIEDQNDVSPVFTNKTYTYSLRENELPGSRFGYVSAFDKDTNSILTFGCTNDAQDYFKINNEGVLTLAKSLDLDGNNLTNPISATIFVNDTIHVSYADVIIKIEKVNEFSPQFEHVNYNFSVLENKNAVWNITAHDQDVGEDGHIAKYSLLVPDNWIWTKNVSVTNEGKVHVGGIDRDIMGKNNKLMFAIEATDNGHPSRSGIAYITLIVNGTNDNKPEFPDNEKNVSVILKENLQLYPSIYQSKVRNECNIIYKYITRV
ncbi:cadherin EGF LAG seven-pass G-type receptor 3-like [Ruditapes philippinarum]|uniref:cadherin EGF LAG seven-pass G-type receptor 3-like n=1 Tax=Ruditapes philippinarum TaxID=129788 RepID=UPI00295AE19E|nr:cadherin EGF LAG seven-pass G-type receptor 3-like [Ruditapes philippinarum]